MTKMTSDDIPSYIATKDDRQPPHNIDVEQAFLGAVLMNSCIAEECMDIISEDDFYHGAHGLIWSEVIRRMSAGQRAITPVTLKEWADASIADTGSSYLVDLAASAVSLIGAPDFARTIADLAHKRRLIAIARDMEARAFAAEDGDSAQDIQSRIEADLMAASAGTDDGRGSISLSESVARSVERFQMAHRQKAPSGMLFGLRSLDNILGSIRAHELVIIGARPGMGKTAFATALAVHAARSGTTAAFFSMEMDATEITDRIIASEARLPLSRLSGGKSSSNDMEEIVMAQKALSGLPLVIDERPRQTIASLLSRARRLKRRHNIGLIIIDYLQLISTARADRRESKVAEVTDISRGLKMIAKDLQVPVIALSQLSRQVEGRPDKRPMLSDLRETGAIEQDADKVMFLYRDGYYNKSGSGKVSAATEVDPTLLEVIVAKNRCGRCGTAYLSYDVTTQRVDDRCVVSAPGTA